MTPGTLPVKVESLEREIRCQDEKIDCLQEWVNGNGKPGAKTRIAQLEDSVKRIEDKLDSQTKALNGAAIALTVAFFAWLATNVLPSVLAHIK